MVLSSNLGVAEAKKKENKACVEDDIQRGKELKKYVLKNHVLVVLQKEEEEDDDDSDDDEDSTSNNEYKDLCERLHNTPIDRVKDFEIVEVQESTFRKKVLAKASPPPVSFIDQMKELSGLGVVEKSKEEPTTSEKPNYPEYVLFHKGNFDSALLYTGEDKSANAISDFVALHLQRKKLGNFVYSLGTYDLITSQFVKNINESNPIMMDSQDLPYYKALVWAYIGQMMSLAQHYRPDKLLSTLVTRGEVREDYKETEKLVNTYVKTMFQMLEKGKDYPSQQITRLQNMLESDSDNLSDLKIEQIQQRIYTLNKYVDDVPVVQAEQVRSFIMYTAVNATLWVLMIIMIPMLLLTSEDYEDEGDDDEEEVVEGEGVKDESREEEEEERNGSGDTDKGDEKTKEE